jgi:diguanylate cyclase (GGDEF)-like protein/PAS domain S-box-containing protein
LRILEPKVIGVKRSPAAGAVGRIAARLAVGTMALAVAGLGWAAIWSAVTMSDQATALAHAGAQTGGQLRALQALSMIRIQLSNLGDEGPSPGRLAAVREARDTLPVALDEMERGDVATATAVARQAKPLARELDVDVERYLNDPKGDILFRTVTIQRLTRELGRAPTEPEIAANEDDDDTTRDQMSVTLTRLELMLNGRQVDAAHALSGMLDNVTTAEHNIRVTALVLVPLGLLSAAASAWLLALLRRRADVHNRAERRRMETVLVGLPSPVIVTDEDEAVVLANPAATELTGWTGQLVRTLADLDVHDREGARIDLPGLAAATRLTGRRWEPLDATLTRPDGTVSQVTVEAVPLAAESGRIPGVVVALVDVTTQRKYEEYLHHHAYHDGLTGLPNRAQLWQCINTAVTNAVPYAVLLVDLDGFKTVNDNLGHHIGDELLQGVGNRLSTVGGSSATVARQGGDEFAILLYDAGPEEATTAAAAVRECFTDPFMLSCGPVRGGGSVGFAVAEPGQSPDRVMQLADDQMYRSKPRSRQGARPRTPENAP